MSTWKALRRQVSLICKTHTGLERMIQEQIKGEVHVVTFRCDVSEKESITQAG